MAKQVASIEDIIAKYGLKRGSDYSQPEDPRIPFAIPELNRMTYGGLPRGRLVEFFGIESGGKTTTALSVISQAQKEIPDKACAYIDVEHTFDPAWAKKMGVDVDNILVHDCPVGQTAGEVLDLCMDIAETGQFSVMVLDSLAGLVSEAEWEKTTDERVYAGISKELTVFSKKMSSICAATDTLFIGINQLREEMNAQYVANRTPGGKAWKFHCSVRIEFRRGSFIGQDGQEAPNKCENPMGHFIVALQVKNKTCPNDCKLASYTLNYHTGLDPVADVLECALKLGIVEKKGAWLTWGDTAKWNGRVKAQETLRQNEKQFNSLSAAVNCKLFSV